MKSNITLLSYTDHDKAVHGAGGGSSSGRAPEVVPPARQGHGGLGGTERGAVGAERAGEAGAAAARGRAVEAPGEVEGGATRRAQNKKTGPRRR